MEDYGACSACKRSIAGTYVSCSHCLLARICTRCYLTNTVHHEHEGSGQKPVTKKEKPKYMTRMMASENGRGRGDDS